MAWTAIYESEQVSLVADREHGQALLEVSSGGYRPRYMTLRMNAAELDLLIEALQRAKAEIVQ
ncbi:hypothetical protein [Paenibacillus hamazuiensis]|uniref:hypothetical protein n=1 Tax=Paenibacillus hamazuiensis TaxID=2936508 RepID=UPI00200CA8A4|nr:hypothetical protein [Paenibacillus hamazuiensis]